MSNYDVKHCGDTDTCQTCNSLPSERSDMGGSQQVLLADEHLDKVISEGIIAKNYLKRCTCKEWSDYMTYMDTFILEHKVSVKHMIITMRYCPYCKTGLNK